jgi:hypothetical protein
MGVNVRFLEDLQRRRSDRGTNYCEISLPLSRRIQFWEGLGDPMIYFGELDPAKQKEGWRSLSIVTTWTKTPTGGG